MERLARGSSGRLTLVSAPAGWGRTTAVLEWRRWVAGRHRFAWVSLDADDSDPARFWAYVVHALAEALPERLHEPLRLTEIGADPRRVPVPSLVNALGDLVERARRARPRRQPSLQVTVIPRARPALPLARLRARGELAEVRAADLRFSRTVPTPRQ